MRADEPSVAVLTATEGNLADWSRLREALWPDDDAVAHAAQARAILATPDRTACWLALVDEATVGFAEASIRHDYVNGCDGSPVLFLEGLYVAPSHRRLGLARRLTDAVAAWGRARRIGEFASDALASNRTGRALHRALGFTETERVVFFRRPL